MSKINKKVKSKMNAQNNEHLRKTIAFQKQCDERAFKIVEKLIENPVYPEIFVSSLKYISPSHLEDVFEERSIVNNCAYPICLSKLNNIPKKQFSISTRFNKVFDISERKKFCSNQCYKAALFIKGQMLTSPLWMRDKEEIPKFKLLPWTKFGTPGKEVDLGVARIDENIYATSFLDFTEEALNELGDELDEIDLKTLPEYLQNILRVDSSKEINNCENLSAKLNIDAKKEIYTNGESMKNENIRKIVKISIENDLVNGCKYEKTNEKIDLIQKEVYDNKINNTFNELKLNLNDINEGSILNENTLQSLINNFNVNNIEDELIIAKMNNLVDISNENVIEIAKEKFHIKENQSEKAFDCTLVEGINKSFQNLNNNKLEQLSNHQSNEKINLIQNELVNSMNKLKSKSFHRPKKIIKKTPEDLKLVIEKIKNKNDAPKKVILLDSLPNDKHVIQKEIIHVKNKNDIVIYIERFVKEWTTQDTFEFLLGKNVKNDIDYKYNSLVKKINMLELEDNACDRSILDDKELNPLPDYEKLKEESRRLQIKVRSFFSGQIEVPSDEDIANEIVKENVKVTRENSINQNGESEKENFEGKNEFILPITEKFGQNVLRKNILLDLIYRILTKLFLNLNLDLLEQLRGDVHALVNTFKLTAGNIIFKPIHHELLGLILLKMLSIKNNWLMLEIKNDDLLRHIKIVLETHELHEKYLEEFFDN